MSYHPPPSPGPRTAVYERCLQEAADAARLALAQCIDHAVMGLQLAETQSTQRAEREELGLAWRELLNHKDRWCEQYPKDLRAAFSSATTSAVGRQSAVAAEPRASLDLDLDMFSLVDSDQVEKTIESSRLLQQMLPAVGQALAELDALMSSAQGLSKVSPELNPVRPEVYARALRTLMDGAAVEPAINALWVKNLAEPMGRELRRIYEKLINLLELAQVRAASYRVLPTPAPAVRSQSAAGLAAQAAMRMPAPSVSVMCRTNR